MGGRWHWGGGVPLDFHDFIKGSLTITPTPPETNMDTQSDGLEIGDSLVNMAIFGI